MDDIYIYVYRKDIYIDVYRQDVYRKDHYNTLYHTATHCNTQYLLRTSGLHRCFPWKSYTVQHSAKSCNTLQHTAAHCNTLQQTANCNKLYFLRIWGLHRSLPFLPPRVKSHVHNNTNCNTLQHTATHCTSCGLGGSIDLFPPFPLVLRPKCTLSCRASDKAFLMSSRIV